MSESIPKLEQQGRDKAPNQTTLVSRRALVKSLGVVGIASATALPFGVGQNKQNATKAAPEHIDDKHNGQTKTGTKEVQNPKSHEEKSNHSLLETFSESSLLEIGEIVAIRVFNELGYKNIPGIESEIAIWENKSSLEKIPSILNSVCRDPFFEEFLTRLIPSALINAYAASGDKYRWDVGVPTALLFALIHNVSDVGGQKETKLKFTSLNEFIPVPQFISGIFYWYMMREKGFNHAVLAHATQNATIISIAELLSRMYPKQGGAPA